MSPRKSETLKRIQKTTAAQLATIAFGRILVDQRLAIPVPEFRFAPPRKFRFDYAWPEAKLALEVDGGVFINGRHTRGAGWLKDTEKLNLAATLGWRMLRCTPTQLASPELISVIREALKYNEQRGAA